MKNEIDNTVERIGQLDGEAWIILPSFTERGPMLAQKLKNLANAYTKAVADLATERTETATLTTQLNEMREALRELCEATKDARLLYVYGVVQMPTDYEDSRANQTRCEGEAKLMFSKIDFAQTKAKALLDKSGED